MPSSNKLKDLYIKIESLRGKELAFIILTLMGLFIILGFTIGYGIFYILNRNELTNIRVYKEHTYLQKLFSNKTTKEITSVTTSKISTSYASN